MIVYDPTRNLESVCCSSDLLRLLAPGLVGGVHQEVQIAEELAL